MTLLCRMNAAAVVGIIVIASASAHAQSGGSDDIKFKPERLSIAGAGSQCRTAKIQAINNTGSSINDPAFSVTPESNIFSIDSKFQKCPNPLESGQTCRVYVRFCPPDFRTHEATLTFSGSARQIPVVGTTSQRNR